MKVVATVWKEKGTPTISQVVGVHFLKERKEREKRVCKFGQKCVCVLFLTVVILQEKCVQNIGSIWTNYEFDFEIVNNLSLLMG